MSEDVKDLLERAVGWYQPADQGPEGPRRRAERRRGRERVTAAVVAFALFAGASAFTWIAFRHTRATAPGRQPPRPTVAVTIPVKGHHGKQGEFSGDAALAQPAGRAAAAYLQARVSAAVTSDVLAALPFFFVPCSPDIARETYMARGYHAQKVEDGTPPSTIVDTLNPARSR